MALKLRETVPGDIPAVLAIESDPEVARWTGSWLAERHRQAISDPDEAHMVFCRRQVVIGYLLLSAVRSPERNVELRRIALGVRGEGLGAGAIELALGYAFDVLGARRVRLDVLEDNAPARHLYERAGFADDGRAPEPHLLPDGSSVPLRLMSISEERWHERAAHSITAEPETRGG